MTSALWTPTDSAVHETQMYAFMERAGEARGRPFKSYEDLRAWSVEEDEMFWSLFWDFAGITASRKGEVVFEAGESFERGRFFPGARLNYAENMLKSDIKGDALVFWQEDGERSSLSMEELRHEVSRFAQALRAAGVGEGDRVAAMGGNRPEILIALLATASLGAIFSSCSPDYGAAGVLDRFGQVEPKVLLVTQGFTYKGIYFCCREKIALLQESLPSLAKVVLIPSVKQDPWYESDHSITPYDAFLAPFAPQSLTYTQVPFSHPLMILFSSGTTGKPKCIVHAHGGTLIQHLKEHRLHADVRPGDVLFYYTTTSWMMWNWLVSGLGSGATLMLYDGSPFHPGPNVLFDFAQHAGCTHFGVSAKYLDALAKDGQTPSQTHDLSKIRMVMSTGSPLSPEGFDYVYTNMTPNACLASISGGTDIVSCFALGNPIAPVWRGELQTRGLGMAVDVWDKDGKSVVGQKGELVCTKPFPSMPVCFWNDPQGARYHKAYFAHFPGVWRHGDFVELTPHGGLVIHGRSDTVLNPGGVRIGTAEIYRQVEHLDEVQESLVVAQQWQGDVRVILFVKLKDGVLLNEDLRTKIRLQIRENTTPRHVPAKIIQVPDIPRTGSGKIVEMAVTDIINGREVANTDALANPQSLDFYKDIEALRS